MCTQRLHLKMCSCFEWTGPPKKSFTWPAGAWRFQLSERIPNAPEHFEALTDGSDTGAPRAPALRGGLPRGLLAHGLLDRVLAVAVRLVHVEPDGELRAALRWDPSGRGPPTRLHTFAHPKRSKTPLAHAQTAVKKIWVLTSRESQAAGGT